MALGSSAVHGHSCVLWSCTPTWIFCIDSVLIAHTTLHRAFFSPRCTPIVSPILRSCSIPESNAPPALILRVRAGWEKTRPFAPIPHTRNSRSTGTRISGRGWLIDVTATLFR